jgi:hypothetical protein
MMRITQGYTLQTFISIYQWREPVTFEHELVLFLGNPELLDETMVQTRVIEGAPDYCCCRRVSHCNKSPEEMEAEIESAQDRNINDIFTSLSKHTP